MDQHPLFGRVPQNRQIVLVLITVGSIAWVAMLFGVLFPDRDHGERHLEGAGRPIGRHPVGPIGAGARRSTAPGISFGALIEFAATELLPRV
ncbi:MAG TPA: hypothetical protein VGQ58_07095 [Candidatus Limnocylindrales bacterium]|nr:hypothetical protein [Candidatus Limnocylindrales bacterium]